MRIPQQSPTSARLRPLLRGPEAANAPIRRFSGANRHSAALAFEFLPTRVEGRDLRMRGIECLTSRRHLHMVRCN